MKFGWIAICLMLVAPAGFAAEPGLPDFRPLVERNGPAVVNIEAIRLIDLAELQREGQGTPNDENHQEVPDFLERFFGQQDSDEPMMHETISAGSGFVLSSDGYLVTNHHVVENSSRVVVRFPDRREMSATVIGTDLPSDIALLKVDAENLHTVTLGDSAGLAVGEWVMAIGSPFNFEHSVTAGIVSAKGRSFARQQYVPFIQTDVPINRGNSGGPLINMAGEVIGVNSQIYSENGSYMGLSFSIPIEVVMSVVNQLKSGHPVRRGLLGIGIEDVTRDLATSLGLDQPYGAIVNFVAPDSAAERAGIRAWDVILSFNDRRVERFSDLPPIVGLARPGSDARVELFRDGKRMSLPVSVGELLAGPDQPLAEPAGMESPRERFGLELEALGGDVDNGGGLRVSAVQGLTARRAGFRVGDVIISINRKAASSLEDFDRLTSNALGRPTAFLVRRGFGAAFVVISGPTI
jgi:serine protease Do